jgi:hypothetical protein
MIIQWNSDIYKSISDSVYISALGRYEVEVVSIDKFGNSQSNPLSSNIYKMINVGLGSVPMYGWNVYVCPSL